MNFFSGIMMSQDKVAVVILNWNGAKMLRDFLPSVVCYSQSMAQVVVADNGSTDESAEVVAKEFPEVLWLPLDKNYGFAEGYNRALAQLETDYFVLLNSDVEVTEGWLSPLVDYMESHPGIAACQPKLMSWYHRKQFEYAGGAGGFIDYLGYPFCRGRVMGCVEDDRGQYDQVCSLFWATGAALMIRRADWISSGGLDGGFFAHMEEIDLCWRLRARGRGIVCVPSSRVYHLGAATLKRENPRKTYLNFRNNLLMIYKNASDTDLHKVLRWRWILDNVAALKFLLTGDLKNACAVVKARRDFHKLVPQYQQKRAENLAKTSLSTIPECMTKSLLLAYYLKGKRTFSALYASEK